MKHFLKRFCALFLIPILAILVLVIFWDPFKVFFSYEDYYTKNVITLNREDMCYKLFNKRNNENISNFIIGSSRSIPYRTNNWSKLIKQKPQNCFHFDGSAMNLFRATRVIQYLDKSTNKINNILLIIDINFFEGRENDNGHLVIQPPKISGVSKFKYYGTFIKAAFNPKFILDNIIYKITGKYYEFMGHHILRSRYYHVSNNLTGDVIFGSDKEIKKDSSNYYNKLLSDGVFYKRGKIQDTSAAKIDNIQYTMLQKIKKIVMNNKCQIKIVISPLYSQIKINDRDKERLIKLFGKKSIFDFSGKNNFTEDYTNYYESSHYKPCVANQIMKFIYISSSKLNN